MLNATLKPFLELGYDDRGPKRLLALGDNGLSSHLKI
jgi:hypothetical protein